MVLVVVVIQQQRGLLSHIQDRDIGVAIVAFRETGSGFRLVAAVAIDNLG